jgi:hypothetical protein
MTEEQVVSEQASSESAPPQLAPPSSGITGAIGARFAALLLGAACIAWAAIPPVHTSEATGALFVAVVAVLAGVIRLFFTDIPQPEDQFFVPGYVKAWLTFLGIVRALAWEETAVVALLLLEIMHTIRPWPSAALGAGLFAYLLTTHIAESGTPAASLLGRYAKVLVAGACLLALGAGLATVPAVSAGAGSAVVRVLAALAVVAATALVLPA